MADVFSIQYDESYRDPLERDYDSLRSLAASLLTSLKPWLPTAFERSDVEQQRTAELGTSMADFSCLVADFDDFHFNHSPGWPIRNVRRAYVCMSAEAVIRSVNPFSAEEIRHLVDQQDDLAGSPDWKHKFVERVTWYGGGPRLVESWAQLLRRPPVASPGVATVELVAMAAADLGGQLKAEIDERFSNTQGI